MRSINSNCYKSTQEAMKNDIDAQHYNIYTMDLAAAVAECKQLGLSAWMVAPPSNN